MQQLVSAFNLANFNLAPVNREGPLHDLIKSLEKLENVDLVDWNAVVKQFVEEYSTATSFVPGLFPTVEIKQKFLALFKKDRLLNRSATDEVVNDNLTVLRLMLREVNGSEELLALDVLNMVLELFEKFYQDVSDYKLYNVRTSVVKCLLNLLHHSADFRSSVSQNESVMSLMDSTIRVLFTNEKVSFISYPQVDINRKNRMKKTFYSPD